MNSEMIKVNDEEFPESILNAPKIKFLRPKKEPNFGLLEEEFLLPNETILEENLKKNTANKMDVHSKHAKRKILEYIKKMPSNPVNGSNSYYRSD